MPSLLGLVFGAAAAGAVGIAKKNSPGVVRDDWRAAGAILGMRHSPGAKNGMHLLTGIVDGFNVRVETVPSSNGLATRYDLQFPSGQEEPFTLTKQSTAPMHALKKMTGQTDITIDDEHFDKHVVIDATDPDMMNRYLTIERRKAVLHMFNQSFSHASITNSAISIESASDLSPTADEIVRIVTGMVMTAETLSEPVNDEFTPAHAKPASAPAHLYVVPQLAEKSPSPQDAIRPSNHTEVASPAHAAAPKLSTVATPEATTQAVELDAEAVAELPPPPVLLSPLQMPERSPAAPLEPPAEVDEPAPPVLATPEPSAVPAPTTEDVHDGPVVDLAAPTSSPDPVVPDPVMSDPVPETPEATEQSVEEEAAETEDVSLAQQDVISDLLGSDRMGFETDEWFASTYAGQTIEWQGMVDTVRDFRHDTDFDGAGKKVTLLLGSSDDSTLLSHRVFAVIAVAPDAVVERGEELSFTGELHRLDRFTKQLVVFNAEIDWPLQQAG